MAHSVRKHLRLEIEAYDATIRRFIPGYETMLGQAADAVAEAVARKESARATDPPLVVDLGAGTGALAAAVLERSPDAVVRLVDIDREMLSRARIRLAPFGGRAQIELAAFSDPLPDCDAVMASLALHHVPTLAKKAALFARVHDAVRPGGVLVNADVTMPAGGPERAAAYEGWAAHLVDNRITQHDAYGHFDAWSEEDTYFPLEAELQAMTEAGLLASCLWQEGVSTVTLGRRTE